MMDNLRIARVFPRRTKATPDDALAFTSPPPKSLFDSSSEVNISNIDEIHISVTFTYDIPKAEQMADSWAKTGLPIKFGGPAEKSSNTSSGNFIPGMYLKKGYVITSRGCDNNCWFCAVPKREGSLRELPITQGFNIVDNNLLGCSDNHIRAVFNMLKNQKEKPIFTGGLEAKLLKEWHVGLLREAKTKRLYCAYDTPDDLEYLVHAGKLLRNGGITKTSQTARCYVLIGYQGDTMEKAEKRLRDTWAAGFLPYAMLYRDEMGEITREWARFQRIWARPQIVHSLLKSS